MPRQRGRNPRVFAASGTRRSGRLASAHALCDWFQDQAGLEVLLVGTPVTPIALCFGFLAAGVAGNDARAFVPRLRLNDQPRATRETVRVHRLLLPNFKARDRTTSAILAPQLGSSRRPMWLRCRFRAGLQFPDVREHGGKSHLRLGRRLQFIRVAASARPRLIAWRRFASAIAGSSATPAP